MTLDEYFTLGKSQLKEHGAVTNRLLALIMRDHGGLAWSLGKVYGKRLSKGECISYLWEALPTAITEWNPVKGSSAMAVTLVFCRLMSRRNEQSFYCGSVRIPPKRLSDYHALRLSFSNDASELECVITSGLEFGELYGEAKTRGRSA